jgi:hypothetical protein
MSDYKKREDILLKLVNTLIVPKHPEIINVTVKSKFHNNVRKYTVTLFFKSDDVDLMHENYHDLHDEIGRLFKMASLNVRNPGRILRDFVLVDVDII